MEKKACTFFGHRDCPETIKPKIRTAVIDLIENHGVTMFYVGNQGNFDRLVRSVLKETTRARCKTPASQKQKRQAVHPQRGCTACLFALVLVCENKNKARPV